MNACLADPQQPPAASARSRSRASAEEMSPGTPTFFINGDEDGGAAAGPQLEPLLRARGGRLTMTERRSSSPPWPHWRRWRLPARDAAPGAAARPPRRGLDPGRGAHARRRLPHGQSRRAGEAGRICRRSPARIAPRSRARAARALRNRYVRSGRVSWEYRPYMIFPTDPGVFLLLRCLGPQAFFRVAEQLYADSAQLGRARLQALPQAAAPAAATASRRAQHGGRPRPRRPASTQFFRARGLPAARINACLANAGNLEPARRDHRRASAEEGVQGTPTFFINGEQAAGSSAGRSSSRCCAPRWAAKMGAPHPPSPAWPRLAALAFPPPAPSRSARAGAAGRRRSDAPRGTIGWTAVRTPEGGFRIGNPDAPVKLVEYLLADLPALRRIRP